MLASFSKVVRFAFISVYFIFLAGSFVRMTGSGMGCPDWPKCFGYYIPPTSEQQLLWQPNKTFEKGMIITKDEVLLTSKKDFITSSEYNPSNWEQYTKHDYAIFNVFHTWTEYINRLVSVLAGFVFLFLIYKSLAFWNTKRSLTVLSFLAFLLMLFEAWLGKTVVDSNLKPTLITIHMVVGLLIIGVLLRTYFLSRPLQQFKTNSLFTKLLIVSVIFSLIQVAMGTQVRQFIDEQVKLFGFENKNYSLMNPSFKFYFHRSFTIAIVFVNFGMFYLNHTKQLGYQLVNWIMILIFLEIITGILMYYAEFPIGTQAIHLMAGAILFGLQFYLWMQSREEKAKLKI